MQPKRVPVVGVRCGTHQFGDEHLYCCYYHAAKGVVCHAPKPKGGDSFRPCRVGLGDSLSRHTIFLKPEDYQRHEAEIVAGILEN